MTTKNKPATATRPAEHAPVKGVIAQIEGMDLDDSLDDARITVLGEYIAHYANEDQDEGFWPR